MAVVISHDGLTKSLGTARARSAIADCGIESLSMYCSSLISGFQPARVALAQPSGNDVRSTFATGVKNLE